MAAITSRGNATTEGRLRGLLMRAGISGWQLHGLREIGSPDFFFPTTKLAVFVHGCFWHSCPRCGHIPKTNSKYWSAKLARNRHRDRRVEHAARRHGYRVIRIWECALREHPGSCLRKIELALRITGSRNR
jgi:DNA mismatch endonuclease (patch repair protein)